MTTPMGTDPPGGTNSEGEGPVVDETGVTDGATVTDDPERATAIPRSGSDYSLRSRERRARTFFRRGPQSRVMTDERPRDRGRAGGVV